MLDENNSTQENELFTRAYVEYNNEKYDESLNTLRELENISPKHKTKIKHNCAVIAFSKSNSINFQELLKTLNELYEEEIENAKLNSSGVCFTPIANYNKAIIYYNRSLHRTGIKYLLPVVEKLESFEENFALLVSTLMLRLLLASQQLNRAQHFLALLQIKFPRIADSLLPDENFTDKQLLEDFKLLAMLTNVLNRRTVAIPDDGSLEFSALKARQYYIMKDFQMAAKQLKIINTESNENNTDTDILKTCIANNMGIIHLRVRHYAIAAKFFQNAITFDKQIASNMRNIPLYDISSARSCEILYNLGISMLHLRRPKEAFQCFLVPLKFYHSNPRFWTRMAEACIMEHEMKLLLEDKKPMVSSVVNIGSRRKYILKPTPRTMYPPSTQCAVLPEPTMEFAILCLRNALTLTKFYKSSFSEQNEEGGGTENQNWKEVIDNNFCTPSAPISKDALDRMLSAIYTAYSYVSIRLGDYVTALEMARECSKSEKLSDAHKMLVKLYSGQALIMMDKIGEARSYLDPQFVNGLNAFDFETKDWQVKSLEAAQNVVRYNLAVAFALQGDFDGTSRLLNTCTHPVVIAKTMALKIYVDIKTGKYCKFEKSS
ncbi:CCR4-NOT transcription complex subunit 10-like [Teleopsis dalmanni]|uniref:CCR4-NOT transcription complex subunit 10-like n=1 Tax=Teleopsis dalmanni TaxID=139649 RepID=UPI0018CDD27D|nr:CCR4-NOT transcription complex subunit 10-like [Teleopsis dalmanni]